MSTKALCVVLLAGPLFEACSPVGSASVAQLPAIYPCQLSSPDGTVQPRRVAVRGRLVDHSHGYLLVDAKCPDVAVILETASNGPDLSFCSSETLSERCGCPAGGNQGLIITIIGTLPKWGVQSHLLVTVEMKDPQVAASPTGA